MDCLEADENKRVINCTLCSGCEWKDSGTPGGTIADPGN